MEWLIDFTWLPWFHKVCTTCIHLILDTQTPWLRTTGLKTYWDLNFQQIPERILKTEQENGLYNCKSKPKKKNLEILSHFHKQILNYIFGICEMPILHFWLEFKTASANTGILILFYFRGTLYFWNNAQKFLVVIWKKLMFDCFMDT